MSTASAVGERLEDASILLSEADLGRLHPEINRRIGGPIIDDTVVIETDHTDDLATQYGPARFVNDRLGGHLERQTSKNVFYVTLPEEAYSRHNIQPGSASYACMHWFMNMYSRIIR